MRFLWWNISRTQEKQAPTPTLPLSSYGYGSGGWFNIVKEPFTGAWQKNMELRGINILASQAVYACLERIAADIASCRIRLVEQDENQIWNETFAAAFSPVLRKPNNYQTRIQFFEAWMLSKLMHGNTYVLKSRDERGVVVELYILDPCRTSAWVAPNGDVFYKCNRDNLAGLNEDNVYIPATEIIHDMMTLKHHPLCGIPPMAPAAISAVHGLTIQGTSTRFFQNAAQPSGVLTAEGDVSDADAARLKAYWDEEYSKGQVGKVAVLGGGLKFEPMMTRAVDAQLFEQLGLTAKMVCTSFGVPPFMVNIGDPPTYNNIGPMNKQYYNVTLRKHFEAIELLLDEGLGLTAVRGRTYGTEFDLDDLFRLDQEGLVKSEAEAVKGGIKAPNEARLKLNLGPVPGGKYPYLQQQNYSLEALSKRDEQDDPFATSKPAAAPADTPPAEEPAEPTDQQNQFDEFDEAAFSWIAREEMTNAHC